MNSVRTWSCRAILALGGAALFGATSSFALAQGLEDKVVIITSFSKDVTGPFAAAFEKKHPGTKVEVQNRNTNAAVAFIRETQSNPPDIMWASAPDAFEVLKKHKLLAKYVPKAQGIPEKVGAYPINDPAGYYIGFAASGYGIMYNTRYMQANKLPAPKEWDDLKKAGLFRPCRYLGAVALGHDASDGRRRSAQGEGWDKGWATLLEIGGNLTTVLGPQLRRAGRRQQRAVRHRHRYRLFRTFREGSADFRSSSSTRP